MLFKTFRGGVHPPTAKGLTSTRQIKKLLPPSKVIVPLIQHTGTPAEVTVREGDSVKCGTLIGRQTAFISSNIHSPISGTVKEIAQQIHPTVGFSKAVVIESDGKDEVDFKPPNIEIKKLSPETIIDIVKEAGIVGLGGAAFPTHVKLSPPKSKKIEFIILNGAECEPYLTCDHRLMLEKPGDIIKGLRLMMKALCVEKAYIGVEANKQNAIESLNNANVGAKDIEVVKLKVKYPQGGEKQLINAILNREVPSGGLPFDVGVVVHNVATAAAIAEAVYQGKPLYERVITVSGDCIKEPANLLVRIGTTVEDIIEACGGLVKEPAKVIFGGPIMGVAQYSLDVPVIKGTCGILFLSKDKIDLSPHEVCIRCGSCVRACPVWISPAVIGVAVERSRFDVAREYDLFDCIECGACSYICPAKRDLVGLIKYAKLMSK